jgi:hypothetical protein
MRVTKNEFFDLRADSCSHLRTPDIARSTAGIAEVAENIHGMKETCGNDARRVSKGRENACRTHQMSKERLSRSSKRSRKKMHGEVVSSSNECEIRLIGVRSTELRVQLEVCLSVRLTHEFILREKPDHDATGTTSFAPARPLCIRRALLSLPFFTVFSTLTRTVLCIW